MAISQVVSQSCASFISSSLIICWNQDPLVPSQCCRSERKWAHICQEIIAVVAEVSSGPTHYSLCC